MASRKIDNSVKIAVVNDIKEQKKLIKLRNDIRGEIDRVKSLASAELKRLGEIEREAQDKLNCLSKEGIARKYDISIHTVSHAIERWSSIKATSIVDSIAYAKSCSLDVYLSKYV